MCLSSASTGAADLPQGLCGHSVKDIHCITVFKSQTWLKAMQTLYKYRFPFLFKYTLKVNHISSDK